MTGLEKPIWRCWKCGVELKELILPLSRREECPDCRAELHVCRMCEWYDPRVSDHCREERAEAVSDATRANFCDYFKLSTNTFSEKQTVKQTAAKAELEALFGGGDVKDNNERKATDGDEALSKEEAAKRELARLFGEDDKKN
ncbi:MAG TPA: hypothetical protein VF268_10480 [Gammaproteobacteria bacterium]|jgi:hypothetical protein